METVKDVFDNFREGLAGLYEVKEIEAIALSVLTNLTQQSKASIKAFPENKLAVELLAQLYSILTELETGKPLQYILGESEFYGLKFAVNPSVLIPRPETEELVEWLLGSVKSQQGVFNADNTPYNHAPRILDIGTGSGCIAISLKKNLPQATVVAIDISPEALVTAKQNAAINSVEVDFVQADILNTKSGPGTDLIAGTKYHVIVSNPPYVTPADKRQMHINVTEFEPHAALFVPENDPLLFYKAIADFAIKGLNENGLLFFEINESYGKETVDMLHDKLFKNIELRNDMSGRPRMVKANV
ncbi:peptide chain release factor N(5)-glutamine methyltransferase [Mucilaginibacter hurinus]|uniref:peptide chain release factor N(5)-glutamine methyltransferase n=1 Tax=Mucilaginibacter hurinus TaxID=2201324 RepID=A0A367GS42_9SPHI|nr:peptide chain release factor N(5)-glutamine methyltransferase [Mucilaginibacter hurinus]RCH56080.1 peptide chain release factor N(5)-glutamine methyltransferase [Mucilaginibacter hurinus]